MAQPGRVQVREFQREAQLSPAPVVNVQPVAPVNRQGEGSNLMRIAESLAGFGNSFTRFGMSQVALGERQRNTDELNKAEAEREAAKTAKAYSLYTFDEIQKARKDNPQLDSDAIDAVTGRALGIEFRDSMFQDIIGDPNWDGSADMIRQKAIEYAKEKGLNEIGMAAYSDYLDGIIQQVQQNKNVEITKDKMTEQVSAAERVAQEHGKTILELELKKAGNDPVKMEEAYKTAANAQLKELRDALPSWASNEEKQKSDIRAVEAAVAAGDMQLLNALLADDRGGVGSLGNITALQPQVEAWKAKADANFREKNKTTGLQFELEAYGLLENPETTFEQFDQWATRAAPYMDPDKIGSFRNRFTVAQTNLAQKRAAVSQNTKDKETAIQATVGWLMTGEGPGGTFLKDGVEVTSESDLNAKTTLSSETVKKETTNYLKRLVDEKFPDDVRSQTLFLVPRLKQGNLDLPEHKDAIERLIMANPTEKLKAGLDKADDEALEMIETLVTTGDVPYLNKITPESGKLFMGVLQSKLEAGINPRQALRDTYSIMTRPEKAAEARKRVSMVDMGFNGSDGFTDLMDGSDQGASLLAEKLYQKSLAGANILDENVRKQTAEEVKRSNVKIGQAFVPKNIIGWGANTGEDIKGLIEDMIPKIGPKMVPPIESIDDLSIRQTADGFVFVDTNSGLPLMAKTTKGGVSSSELLIVRKEDVDAFRKLKADRQAIPAETYQKRFLDLVDRNKTLGDFIMGPRGVQRMKTPGEIIEEQDNQTKKNIKDKLNNGKSNYTKDQINAARRFWSLDEQMTDKDVENYLLKRSGLPPLN